MNKNNIIYCGREGGDGLCVFYKNVRAKIFEKLFLEGAGLHSIPVGVKRTSTGCSTPSNSCKGTQFL